MDKHFVVNLLFDDGILTVSVAPDIPLSEDDFDVWSNGVEKGIAAYIALTKKSNNLHEKPSDHEHNYKYVEPSEDGKQHWFYCVVCEELMSMPDDEFKSKGEN